MNVLAIFFALALLAAPQGVSASEPDEAFEGTQIVWPEFPDAAPDAPTARIGFVFDPVNRTREAGIAVGETVDVLLVAWDVQVALHAWEARLDFDPRLTVVEKEYLADLHLELEDGGVVAMVKPPNCSASAEIVLARFKLFLAAEPETGIDDLVLGVGPTAKPSQITVESDAPSPSPIYQVCREDKDIRPFLFSEVSAVLNPVHVEPEPVQGERPRFRPAPGRGRSN